MATARHGTAAPGVVCSHGTRGAPASQLAASRGSWRCLGTSWPPRRQPRAAGGAPSTLGDAGTRWSTPTTTRRREPRAIALGLRFRARTAARCGGGACWALPRRARGGIRDASTVLVREPLAGRRRVRRPRAVEALHAQPHDRAGGAVPAEEARGDAVERRSFRRLGRVRRRAEQSSGAAVRLPPARSSRLPRSRRRRR